MPKRNDERGMSVLEVYGTGERLTPLVRISLPRETARSLAGSALGFSGGLPEWADWTAAVRHFSFGTGFKAFDLAGNPELAEGMSHSYVGEGGPACLCTLLVFEDSKAARGQMVRWMLESAEGSVCLLDGKEVRKPPKGTAGAPRLEEVCAELASGSFWSERLEDAAVRPRDSRWMFDGDWAVDLLAFADSLTPGGIPDSLAKTGGRLSDSWVVPDWKRLGEAWVKAPDALLVERGHALASKSGWGSESNRLDAAMRLDAEWRSALIGRACAEASPGRAKPKL